MSISDGAVRQRRRGNDATQAGGCNFRDVRVLMGAKVTNNRVTLGGKVISVGFANLLRPLREFSSPWHPRRPIRLNHVNSAWLRESLKNSGRAAFARVTRGASSIANCFRRFDGRAEFDRARARAT